MITKKPFPVVAAQVAACLLLNAAAQAQWIITLDPNDFGGDNLIKNEDIAAFTTLSGTTTAPDGSPVTVAIASPGSPRTFPTTVTGGTWSIVLGPEPLGDTTLAGMNDGPLTIQASVTVADDTATSGILTPQLDHLGFQGAVFIRVPEPLRAAFNITEYFAVVIETYGLEETATIHTVLQDQDGNSITGQAMSAGEPGSFFLPVDPLSLQEGPTTLTVSAADSGGNTVTLTETFELDTRPKITAIETSSNAVVGGEPFTLTVTTDIPTVESLSDSLDSNSSDAILMSGAQESRVDTLRWDLTFYAYPTDNLQGGTFRPRWTDPDGSEILGPEITVGPDHTPPQIVSFTALDPVVETEDTSKVTVTFSEPVIGFNSNDVRTEVVSGANTHLGQLTVSVGLTGSNGGSIGAGMQVNAFYGFFTGVSSGATVRISVDELAGNITDPVGNPLVVSNSGVTLQVVPNHYQQYTMSLGITQWGRDVNTDGDALTDRQEAMHGLNPLLAGDSLPVYPSLVRHDGETFFAVTLPCQPGLTFRSSEDPSIDEPFTIEGLFAFGDADESVLTEILSSTDLTGSNSPVEFMEVIPAATEGLPALPSGFEYRTFRWVSSTTVTQTGFVRVRQRDVVRGPGF